MPIDASIYGQIRPPTINTPFENLRTVMDLRAQQEDMRGRKEQRESMAAQRKEQTDKLARENAEAAATSAAIQQGGGVRDQTLALARANAPHAVAALTEFFDKADERANTIKQARLKIANDQADFNGDVADAMLRHGATPEAIKTGLSYAVEQFPDYADAVSKLSMQLAQAPPDQVKAFLEQIRDASPSRRTKPEQAPMTVQPGQGVKNAAGGYDVPVPREPTKPTSAQEFEYAQGHGYKGTYEQYQTEDANRKRPVVNVDAGAGLDEAGQELLATQYRVVGSSAIPTRISGADRAKIINQAAAQMKVLGQSPAMAIQRQYALKADAGSLNKISTMAATARAFENKAIQQADLVRDLSARVDRTQFPAINRALLAGKKDFLGDADTQLLYNALTTFTAEYAKIIEGSTGSAAGSTDAARKASASLAHAALNKDTLAKTLDLMQKEMRYTIQGYDATKDAITAKMGGAPAAVPSPATSPANETPEQRMRRLLGGG